MMLNIRYLSLPEQNQIDPTGEGRVALGRMSGDSYNPINPDFEGRRRSEYLELYLTKHFVSMNCAKHNPYYAYSTEMISKFGPQGGSFDLAKVKHIYRESYSLAESSRSYDLVLIGQQVLLSLIDDRLARDYRFSYLPDDYKLVKGTSGALPTMSAKGTFDAETVGDFRNWRHLLPMLPGQRRLKGKDRVINQDATSNVRYVEVQLRAVRRWLKNNLPEYFASWLNPNRALRPMIHRGIVCQKRNYEGDYKAMDNHYSLETAERVVLPVYERLLPEADYMHLAHYVQEAFYQPLFMGDQMWSGLHNLFSGVSITNDFETVYSVCLHLGAIYTQLTHKEISNTDLAAIGDDVFLLLPHAISDQRLDALGKLIVAEAASNGLEMQEQKCRIDTGDLRYCRRVYYRSAPQDLNPVTGNLEIVGAYPTILALNSLINPESHSKSAGLRAVAGLSVLDNAYGAPDWNVFVDFVGRMTKSTWDFTQADINHYSDKDWWFRLYGEAFDPHSSKAYARLIKR